MDSYANGTDEYIELTDAPAGRPDAAKEKRRKPTRARTRPLPSIFNAGIDIEPVKYVCRCWRCRAGGVALSDMAPMDRLLSRHLLRLSYGERLAWLRQWTANPNHGPQGRRALDAWMEIERGRRLPVPRYFTKVGV